MRKLATIRKIDQLLPIEGADLILLAKIDGWQCVVKKDEFRVGDLCVYFEIDSWVPHEYKPELSKGKEPRTYNEVKGERLKTVKLRGQVSQGLAMPLGPYIQKFAGSEYDEGQEICEFFYIGSDISDFLGIQKWEAPIPGQLAGQVRGNFPSFISKTDQERCQNLGYNIFTKNANARYEVTMKLDGTSFTAYHRDDREGVCGRNWEFDVKDGNEGNSLVRVFVDSGLQAALHDFNANYAVQGELMGPAIQQNREGLKAHKLYVFDIYDINTSSYVVPAVRYQIMDELYARGLKKDMVAHVPILHKDVSLEELGITNTDQMLVAAEGPSIVHPIREGDVYKALDRDFSFKAISNAFLLKEKD